jgi:hypothetical protein
VIQPKCDGAGDFSEGLAAVLGGGLWGYIDQREESSSSRGSTRRSGSSVTALHLCGPGAGSGT